MSARPPLARAVGDSGLWHRPRDLDRITHGLLLMSLLLTAWAGLCWLARQPALGIDQVRVAAAPVHVTQRQVEDVVRRELRGTFFTIDLEASRRAFARLPWVREATVARRWPATLEVQITEYEAIAAWQDGGLVDRDGAVFQGAGDAELPVFGGPYGSSRLVAQRYAAARDALARVGLTPRAIELSPRHAWSIELKEGPRIELGRASDLAPLQRFLAVYPQAVAPLLPQVSHIDLRYRNGFALRGSDGKPLLPGGKTDPAATPRKA
ncbi:MAG: FtsQ-type POTRA domain-containing protein [Rhodocyclaceae bacterium]|nr:FtsQ-type POTRA domain-containing protein [Rhodocyclaceae bacterium]